MRTIRIALCLAAVLAAAACRPAAPDSGGGADPYPALERILSDPDLQRPSAPPPDPIEMPDIALPRVGSDLARLALMVAGGIGLALVIVVLGPALARALGGRRAPGGRAGDPAEDVADAADAVARAGMASGARDYRQAVRLLYLAALLALDEAGALRYDRAQTNREYLRQIADRPGLADLLRPVVETFDEVWYGFRPVTPDGYRRFESQVGSVLQAAQPPPVERRDSGRGGRP